MGYGFLEKVYENAMMIELKSLGLQVTNQRPINVFYHENEVGLYYADLVVNDKIILELKAEESLHPRHEAQLVNYLKGTEIEIGLLFNFGVRPQFSRKIFTQNKNEIPRRPV